MIRFGDITIDRKNRTISHRDKSYQFQNNGSRNSAGENIAFRLVCYFLLSGGASKEMAFWHLYGADSEGGPLAGPHVIYVMLNQIHDRALKNLELEVRSWRVAGVTFYEIVPTFQLKTPNRFSHRNVRRVVQAAGAPISQRSV